MSRLDVGFDALSLFFTTLLFLKKIYLNRDGEGVTFCVWRLCLQYTSVHGDLSDGRFMGYLYVLSSPTFFSPSFLRNPLKGKLMGRSEVFPVLVNLSTGSLLDLVNHRYLIYIGSFTP